MTEPQDTLFLVEIETAEKISKGIIDRSQRETILKTLIGSDLSWVALNIHHKSEDTLVLERSRIQNVSITEVKDI